MFIQNDRYLSFAFRADYKSVDVSGHIVEKPAIVELVNEDMIVPRLYFMLFGVCLLHRVTASGANVYAACAP